MKKYYLKFPSQSGNLDEFSAKFPKLFLRSETLYLKDLAQLELLLHQSIFTQKIENKFEIKKFKKLSPEKFADLVFTIHPHCKLFYSKFAICSIWQNKKEVQTPQKPEFMLILEERILKLDEIEFLLLSLLQKKKKLYEIYKKLCQKTKTEIDIGQLVQRFILNGVIINYA